MIINICKIQIQKIVDLLQNPGLKRNQLPVYKYADPFVGQNGFAMCCFPAEVKVGKAQ